MRICSPELGISPKSILGGEIYDREILSGLSKKHQVEVILPLGKPFPLKKNLHVTYMLVPFVYPPYLYNLYVLPYLFAVYRKRTFDILRIHSPLFLGLAASFFKKVIPSVPVVGVYHWLGEGGTWSRYADPYLLRIFDAVICDSHFTRKQIIQLFPNTANKIFTIHNGVDPLLRPKSKSDSLLKKYNIGKDTVVLLFMGLFTERKNPLFLIKIIRELISHNQDILLLLCGKGELEEEIRKRVHAYNLQKYIQVVLPVFGAEKNALLSAADIFVHPALKEGFPLAVIEAMAVGLPVVINDVTSAREAVVHGMTGFCVTSETDWINSLTQLISNRRLRNSMSIKSIAQVKKNFTWDISVKKHITLFKELLNKRAPQKN